MLLAGKCKNSVFCVFLFISFFLGTISGVFCFQCLLNEVRTWIRVYCEEVSLGANLNIRSAVFAFVRPFVFMGVFIIHPVGYKIVFPAAALRGFLTSYYISALWIGDCDLCLIILRELVVLPLYFLMAYFVYFRCKLR